MKRFLLNVLAVVVGLFLFTILTVFGISSLISGANRAPDRPETMVLAIDLRPGFSDQAQSGFLGLGSQPGFSDLILNLRAAETDPAVKGIYVRGSDFGLGSARSEELRAAFKRFQANGKFIVASTQGSLFQGPSGYRAIATADEIWMQPGTEFSIPGLAFEGLYLGGLMERLALKPEFVQLYEYKSAIETYTRDSMSAEARESLGQVGNAIWEFSIADIAADRGRDAVTVRADLESSPFSAESALEKGYISNLGYPIEAFESAKARAGGEDTPVISVFGYQPRPLEPDAPYLAIVGGEGAIVMGGGDSGSPFGDEPMFGADQIASALLQAGKDERVKAIIFRVESPGGDATASDQVWHAVKRVREEYEKPVVVSMGQVAASGGYYVSASADKIFANPSTITGSIGVFGGKIAITDAAEKIGVTFDTEIIGGPFADAFGADPFTPDQYAVFEAQLVRTYDRFIQIVDEGRPMDEAATRAVAKGRIWSGAEGVNNGLVDQTGGLIEAIEAAKELAGIEASVTPRILRFPEQPSQIEQLQSLFGASVVKIDATDSLASLVGPREAKLLKEELRRMRSIREGRVAVTAPLFFER